jgi:hypothetical protein
MKPGERRYQRPPGATCTRPLAFLVSRQQLQVDQWLLSLHSIDVFLLQTRCCLQAQPKRAGQRNPVATGAAVGFPPGLWALRSATRLTAVQQLASNLFSSLAWFDASKPQVGCRKRNEKRLPSRTFGGSNHAKQAIVVVLLRRSQREHKKTNKLKQHKVVSQPLRPHLATT